MEVDEWPAGARRIGRTSASGPDAGVALLDDLLTFLELLVVVLLRPVLVEGQERPARLEVLDEHLAERIRGGRRQGEGAEREQGLADPRDHSKEPGRGRRQADACERA